MKVGTDGVLLGAWASLENSTHILDIGSGTGLLSLMAAQRCLEAQVVGVEIDEDAVTQSRENVARSPFSQRICIEQADIREFRWPNSQFDAILCNPPFFTEDTVSPITRRALARSTTPTFMEDLLNCVARLLSSEGCFSTVIPFSLRNAFLALAFSHGFSLARECVVYPSQTKPPKRILLSLVRQSVSEMHTERLLLMLPDGSRTPEYAHLTRNFYL